MPENKSDGLIPPYVINLNMDGTIKLFETMIIPLYETTNLFGNMADWSSDFLLKIQDKNWVSRYLADYLSGLANLQIVPGLKKFLNQIAFGFSNDLVNEVWAKWIDMELDKNNGGRVEDGITFSHSGFFAPLLGALAKPRPDGSYFDVTTIINYEGVHPGLPPFSHDAYINNPNLKRVINVWGTAPTDVLFTANGQWTGQFDAGGVPVYDSTKKPVAVGDFGPPTWSFEDANFRASSPDFKNINIEIVGARHNDFSYDPLDWNDHPYEPERKAREINRLTNKFMRDLYKAVTEDQINPGALSGFLNGLIPAGIAKYENGIWQIDFGDV